MPGPPARQPRWGGVPGPPARQPRWGGVPGPPARQPRWGGVPGPSAQWKKVSQVRGLIVVLAGCLLAAPLRGEADRYEVYAVRFATIANFRVAAWFREQIRRGGWTSR